MNILHGDKDVGQANGWGYSVSNIQFLVNIYISR